MSGAAINIILAPWFQQRRGLAVSLAFNGATLGGVLVTPGLMHLVGAFGFARALTIAALVLLVVLLVIAAAVMRSGPATLGLGHDREPARSAPVRPRAGVDCGFGTFAGRVQVDTNIVWHKLRSLVAGASLASRALW